MGKLLESRNLKEVVEKEREVCVCGFFISFWLNVEILAYRERLFSVYLGRVVEG